MPFVGIRTEATYAECDSIQCLRLVSAVLSVSGNHSLYAVFYSRWREGVSLASPLLSDLMVHDDYRFLIVKQIPDLNRLNVRFPYVPRWVSAQADLVDGVCRIRVLGRE